MAQPYEVPGGAITSRGVALVPPGSSMSTAWTLNPALWCHLTGSTAALATAYERLGKSVKKFVASLPRENSKPPFKPSPAPRGRRSYLTRGR